MSDINAKLASRIFAALKLAAAANRLDVAEHLLRALETLDVEPFRTSRIERPAVH